MLIPCYENRRFPNETGLLDGCCCRNCENRYMMVTKDGTPAGYFCCLGDRFNPEYELGGSFITPLDNSGMGMCEFHYNKKFYKR